MVNLAKMETITVGPPARCAGHDTTLPGHKRTLLLPLEIYSNHHIWPRFRSDWCQDTSDSGCLRRKRWDTNWRDDIVDSREMNYGSTFRNKSPSLKPRRGWGGRWWTQWQFIVISKKMDALNYVNKEITFVRSNDNDVCSRKTYTI